MSLKEVLAKKRVCKTQITKLKQKVEEHDLSFNELEVCNCKLKKLENDFLELFSVIYEKCADDKIESFTIEQEEINDIIDNLELELSKKLSCDKIKDCSSESDGKNNNLETNVKLPRLSLPTFSGNIQDWLSFSDIFKASIHQNQNLSGAMKLQYLKSSLKGDAFRIIQSIAIIDSNYELAWSLLEERYSNKREQVFAHLKRFLSAPNIQEESASAILNLIDISRECIRSLEILGQKIDGFSSIIFAYILCQKLDVNTKLWFERHLQKENLPSISELLEFLQGHARTLSASKIPVNNKKYVKKVASLGSTVNEKGFRKCMLCEEKHLIFKCPKFLKCNVRERVELVRKFNLCFNCLKFHNVRQCPSNSFCNICGNAKKHSYLLCYSREKRFEVNNSVSNADSSNVISNANRNETVGNSGDDSLENLNPNAREYQPISNSTLTATANFKREERGVVLTTAVINIKNPLNNVFTNSRALIDSGSEICIMSSALAEKLGLKKEKTNLSVMGITGDSMNVKYQTRAVIFNDSGDYSRELEFFIVSKVTNLIPKRFIEVTGFEIPKALRLSDPHFYKPDKTHIILGSEVCMDLLKPGKFHVSNTNLILQNSVFGYLVSGSVNNSCSQDYVHCGTVSERENLNEELKRFWEIEHFDYQKKFKSAEEIEANDHFLKTYKRDQSGKFVVQIPFKKDPRLLGNSKAIAVSRLRSLWNRLESNPELLALYRQFMDEYIALGHMQEVTESQEPKIAYYLPHHPIYRPEKSTTKCRVVFNASQVTTSGESLNSLQLNGGVIQDDLFSIVLRFRKYIYAFIADIRMMYRMIWVDPFQHDLQRIVWKETKEGEIKTYKLCTVTYGTTSAPYLAQRCLQQLSIDGHQKYPHASQVIQFEMYMDDVLSGASDLETATNLQRELIELFASCGMQLHKWQSNCHELREIVDNSVDYKFDKSKALGLLWNADSDVFSYTVSLKDTLAVTKREILSIIARIFDPLGLIGPVLTKAKVFLQHLWKLSIEWDDELPPEEVNEWRQFSTALSEINKLSVTRCALIEDVVKIELFGFADASESYYGAAIFLRCQAASGKVTSHLLCSKGKVAPIKTITIPRLELCAAVLLSKLMKKVSDTLGLNCDKIWLFSDSTIVLSWIRKSPCDLKTFVATRVAVIQELSEFSQWRHVLSSDNPADLISRGCLPNTLHENSLWWHGPQFIIQGLETFNENCELEPKDFELFDKELKNDKVSRSIEHSDFIHESQINDSKFICLTSEHSLFFDDLLKLSNNYDKLIRIFSYIHRFIGNCKRKERQKGPLTLEEIKSAETQILKHSQQVFFEKGNIVSKLNCLNVFLDNVGVLRVGGRLEKASLPFEHKHPAVLPKGRLSDIVFHSFHVKQLHVGPQALLNAVRVRFWPLGGRSTARKIVHSCVTCFKVKPKLSSQLMGNLPAERVNPTYAFNHTGLDLCGPFLVKYKNQRKGTLNKVYICVCICLVTRAIHLEILSDLTSEALIATLKRFIARRGRCAKLFSDNATNFIGANAILKKWHKLLNFPDESIAAFLTAESIDWNYIPPKSPHWGGLWEAGVKSVKFHLKRTIGKLHFTYEEFETIVIQIEGILNSRPLTPLSCDCDDFEALTPSHFLIGRPINALIEPELLVKNDSLLSKWQRTTKIVQEVWKRWRVDYLNTLQQRSKWVIEKNNLKVGQMVLIKEDHLPCCTWILGRITKVFPGKDNKVRLVSVKTPTGVFKRPISKIAVLPMEM